MDFLSGIAGKLVIGTLVVSAFTGYYFYNKSTIATLKKNNQTLKVNTDKLNSTIDIQHKTIDKLKKSYAEIEKSKNDINDQKIESEKRVSNLEKKLTKSKNNKKRDINNIADKKTKLLQKILNNGVKQRNRCFELATGSQPTERDKNNKVCPTLN